MFDVINKTLYSRPFIGLAYKGLFCDVPEDLGVVCIMEIFHSFWPFSR